MRVHVIPARDLSPDLVAAWTRVRDSREDLQSPYFAPGFVAAAASCRPGVCVGILEGEGRPVGFFPFELRALRVGQPVGGQLSDFQGVIVPAQFRWRADELVAGCGLRMWRFDHLLCAHAEFAAYHEVRAGSPVMDLRGGFDHYCLRRRQDGSRCIEGVHYKARKLHRQMRDVVFEFDARDPDALEQVIKWKRQQCLRTGVRDFFADGHNVELVRTIHRTRTDDFAGILSVLRVEGRIAAAHFGMRSRKTLHWWFPAYEPELARYSPGTILLVEMARAAADLGILGIDLGKGDDPYKRHFCSHETPVAEGAVVVSAPVATIRRLHRIGVSFLRNSRITAPLRAIRRRLRRRDSGSGVPP